MTSMDREGRASAPGRLAYYRDLVVTLLDKELRARYRNTFMGYAWSVLNPLAFALVFFVLFKIFMKFEDPADPIDPTRHIPYLLFLICGLFPWQWFNNSVVAANWHFVGNSSLIKKVRFPREFLVLAAVFSDLFHFLMTIPVIVIFLLVFGYVPSWHWLWQIPIMVVLQFAFCYGLALLVATCNLFFRDLERLITIFAMLWFYLTPVLFPVDKVPENLKWVLWINPMSPVILNWRDLFLGNGISFERCLVAAGFGVVSLAVGWWVYRMMEKRFAEIV